MVKQLVNTSAWQNERAHIQGRFNSSNKKKGHHLIVEMLQHLEALGWNQQTIMDAAMVALYNKMKAGEPIDKQVSADYITGKMEDLLNQMQDVMSQMHTGSFGASNGGGMKPKPVSRPRGLEDANAHDFMNTSQLAGGNFKISDDDEDDD